MERLFSPCTRLHDLLESQGHLEALNGCNSELLQELNLDVSTEELLNAEKAFTYADLYATLGNENTVAWLAPYAAVVRKPGRAMRYWNYLDESKRLYFSVDGNEISAFARSSERLLEICDIVLRLMAVSVVQSVRLSDWTYDLFINAPTLAYLMELCQSLKTLSLVDLELDENHCRVLGDYSRSDLEIVLNDCKITSAGASALAEVLGRNQGPTKLVNCKIDNSVLANGLRGNSRLKSLRSRFSSTPEVSNREILAIAGALRENKGLVNLDLRYGYNVTDETWDALCDSLKAHPTLEVLDFRSIQVPLLLESRIQALVDMMKVNMSIHTIKMSYYYCEHALFIESVVPYLETNRLRPRLLAIQKTLPHAYREKVLGRALLAVRTDPNHFWMLLSGNSEVAFPSTTVTTTVAASLPAPANAAATENIAPVAVNATVSATAASSAVASDTGQKRKAWP
jgi:hypothetical protein